MIHKLKIESNLFYIFFGGIFTKEIYYKGCRGFLGCYLTDLFADDLQNEN